MNASMTASYTRRSLLTVICEASIESLVAADARRLGAHGYTASDARGWGQPRPTRWRLAAQRQRAHRHPVRSGGGRRHCRPPAGHLLRQLCDGLLPERRVGAAFGQVLI